MFPQTLIKTRVVRHGIVRAWEISPLFYWYGVRSAATTNAQNPLTSEQCVILNHRFLLPLSSVLRKSAPTSSRSSRLHRSFDQSSAARALPRAPVIQARGASVIYLTQAAAKDHSPTTACRRGNSQHGGESFPISDSTQALHKTSEACRVCGWCERVARRRSEWYYSLCGLGSYSSSPRKI